MKLDSYGIWSRHKSTLIRNINGVIFSPIKHMGYSSSRKTGWYETLNVSFNFSPGYTSSDHYKRYVKKYLKSGGVPSGKIDNALQYFETKLEPGTNLIEKKVYRMLDGLYKHLKVKNGYKQGYEYLAGKIEKNHKFNLDDWVTPHKHFNMFTKEIFQKYDSRLYVQSKKEMNDEFADWSKKLSFFDYYKNNYKLRVEIPLQFFKIAKGMSKSKRYNQLQKIKSLLDKKVSTGKVKVYKEKKYTIYEDSFDKYTHGRVAINFKTGEGYWQLPIWDDRKYVQHYFKKITNDVKQVNIILAKYLSICLDETVTKFKNKSSQTSDF